MTVNASGEIDKPTLRDEINSLKNQINQLELRIYQLENPNEWMIRTSPESKCQTCNIEFSGTMGYVCSRTDCPMQPIVTCGNSSR